MKHKDIITRNNKGEWHGHQEWYWLDELSLIGNYRNNQPIGYVGLYTPNRKKVIYFIK
jgi:hypothetical protein